MTDGARMTPTQIETIRALSLHWNQVEIAAWVGCAASTVGNIQHIYAIPHMSASSIQWRSNRLWRQMWGSMLPFKNVKFDAISCS